MLSSLNRGVMNYEELRVRADEEMKIRQLSWARKMQMLTIRHDTINERLSKLCLTEELSDVSFIFRQNNMCKRLPGHKLLLAIRSSVFNVMFYGPMAESCREVEITDIEFDIFSLMLR